MIPQLLLEEINLGEKDAKDYYEKYGKEQLESALAELRKSDQEILAAYPASRLGVIADASQNVRAQTKAAPSANIVRMGKKPRNFYAAINRIAFAAAAALALAVFAPLVASGIKGLSGSPSVRLKGNSHHQIRLYKQDGGGAVQLKNGDTAKESDLVQIAYIPDGDTGEEVPLSFSYELDNARKYECFIFVASKEPFDFSKIESLDKNRLSVDFLKKGSYLPKDCDGSIFILNKN